MTYCPNAPPLPCKTPLPAATGRHLSTIRPVVRRLETSSLAATGLPFDPQQTPDRKPPLGSASPDVHRGAGARLNYTGGQPKRREWPVERSPWPVPVCVRPGGFPPRLGSHSCPLGFG